MLDLLDLFPPKHVHWDGPRLIVILNFCALQSVLLTGHTFWQMQLGTVPGINANFLNNMKLHCHSASKALWQHSLLLSMEILIHLRILAIS